MKNEKLDWESVEKLFDEMIEAHQKKLLMLGRKIVPHLTFEDLLQPNDFPQLENHPLFRYEEGLLCGIETSRIALRALYLDQKNKVRKKDCFY